MKESGHSHDVKYYKNGLSWQTTIGLGQNRRFCYYTKVAFLDTPSPFPTIISRREVDDGEEGSNDNDHLMTEVDGNEAKRALREAMVALYSRKPF